MTDPRLPRLSVTFEPDGGVVVDCDMTRRHGMRAIAAIAGVMASALDPACQCPGCRAVRLVEAAAANYEALLGPDPAAEGAERPNRLQRRAKIADPGRRPAGRPH